MRATARQLEKVWFSTKPLGYWDDVGNQRRFIEDIANKLGISDQPKQWSKQINRKVITKFHGSTLLSKHTGIRPMLETLYPTIDFEFESKPKNYWANIDNQREFMNKYMVQQNMTSLDGWYNVKVLDFKKSGGGPILSKHTNFFCLLQEIYPNHPWDITKRKRRPKNHWKLKENRIEYFKEQAEALGIKRKEDLKSINVGSLANRALSSYYKNSLEMIEDCFPEYDNIELKSKPRNYWADLRNQQKYFEEITICLKIKSLDDWYNISATEIIEHQGDWVFDRYTNLFEALKTIYPQQPWDVTKFYRIPRFHWELQENVTKFMKQVADHYKVKNKEDWYRISALQIRTLGGDGLISKYKTMKNLLTTCLPYDDWDERRITSKNKRSEQRWLYLQIQELFPDVEIVEEFRHPLARESNISLEYDVFIPSINLAIEYQGFHHYKDSPSFGPLELYQQRDKEKAQLSKQFKISLAIVPYTWKGDKISLQQILQEQCPHILSQHLQYSQKE